MYINNGVACRPAGPAPTGTGTGTGDRPSTPTERFDDAMMPTDEANDAAVTAEEERSWREPQPVGLARRAPLPPIGVGSNASMVEVLEEDLDD